VLYYVYNADQELTSSATSYGGTVGPQITYTYDSGGRLTAVSRTSGTISDATEVNTTISYDAANQVVTMTDGVSTYSYFPPGWSTTALATYVYSYDNAGRVTSESDAEGVYSYTYDNSDELTGVKENGTPVGTYTYDLNGNRTGTGYSTGTDNEQTASPGYTYTYDNAGNMTSATNTSTEVTTTYTYDYRNRLTEVTTGGTVMATYTYNALNQRIGFKDSGTQTWTVYDGASADANPYADFNGSGGLTARYLFGATVVNGVVTTGIVARTSSGGTTAWYLTDNLGSVRDIVSTSGTELDHIVYDSFGNIVTETDASNGDRFKFAGMQYDATTGQYYDHARWYGPATGRFLASDPTGFAAGDSNLYRYVGNSSTNTTDASGRNDATAIGMNFQANAQLMAQIGMLAVGALGSIQAGVGTIMTGVGTVATGLGAALLIPVAPVIGVGVAVVGVGALVYLSSQYLMATAALTAAEEHGRMLDMQLMMAHSVAQMVAYAKSFEDEGEAEIEKLREEIAMLEEEMEAKLMPDYGYGKNRVEGSMMTLNELMAKLGKLMGNGPKP